MRSFRGSPCSVCGKPFESSDDVVVCPECGAPYHRACYAEEGHCVHEAKHGSGFEYEPPASAGGGNRCGNCGADNPQGNLFCENCGAALGERAAPQGAAGQLQRTQPTQQPMGGQGGFSALSGQENPLQSMFDAAAIGREYDGVASADWALYIGKSAPYYLYQFAHMDETNRKTSICWSALFFAPFFFAYRKMWGWVAASTLALLLTSIPSFLETLQLLGVNLGFTIPSGTLQAFTLVCAILTWGLQVLFGVFAFYLFRQHGSAKLRAMKQQLPDAAQYQETLQRTGGPSTVSVAILVVASFVLCYAFFFWVGPEKLMALSNSLYY